MSRVELESRVDTKAQRGFSPIGSLAFFASQALLIACGIVAVPEIQRQTNDDQFSVSFYIDSNINSRKP